MIVFSKKFIDEFALICRNNALYFHDDENSCDSFINPTNKITIEIIYRKKDEYGYINFYRLETNKNISLHPMLKKEAEFGFIGCESIEVEEMLKLADPEVINFIIYNIDMFSNKNKD